MPERENERGRERERDRKRERGRGGIGIFCSLVKNVGFFGAFVTYSSGKIEATTAAFLLKLSSNQG